MPVCDGPDRENDGPRRRCAFGNGALDYPVGITHRRIYQVSLTSYKGPTQCLCSMLNVCWVICYRVEPGIRSGHNKKRG